MLPFSLYLAFCAGVLAHYHNHSGVFRGRLANQLYSLWLSIFYGFPIFSWVPTHNQNHHKFTNGPKDAASTFRSGKADSWLEALIYPIRSSVWQLPAVGSYLALLRRKQSPEFVWAVGQSLVVPLAQGLVLGGLVYRHGLGMGALAFVSAMFLPALFAPFAMMFINYLQHVGCDPTSPDNHSRDFVGEWENWLVFQAGLHTVHHEHPGTHWSLYPELHRARKAQLSPILQQRNVLSFLYRRYVLGESEHILRERIASAEEPWGVTRAGAV
jgi:beta-carotene hydroxylase